MLSSAENQVAVTEDLSADINKDGSTGTRAHDNLAGDGLRRSREVTWNRQNVCSVLVLDVGRDCPRLGIAPLTAVVVVDDPFGQVSLLVVEPDGSLIQGAGVKDLERVGADPADGRIWFKAESYRPRTFTDRSAARRSAR